MCSSTQSLYLFHNTTQVYNKASEASSHNAWRLVCRVASLHLDNAPKNTPSTHNRYPHNTHTYCLLPVEDDRSSVALKPSQACHNDVKRQLDFRYYCCCCFCCALRMCVCVCGCLASLSLFLLRPPAFAWAPATYG